jgi:hypothetical protein
VQKAAFVSAMQPHTLTVPPPPQVCGAVQVPQLATVRAVPQLSVPATCPQFLPARVQKAAFVSAAQPHTFTVPPPPQVCGAVQVPQLTVRIVPQLSAPATCPQFLPIRVQKAAFVSAMQFGPHTFITLPPPHVCGAVHVPQLATVRIAPQLSGPVKLPQLLPKRLQNVVLDSGVQVVPHTFAVPPPPHVCGAVQFPQFATVRDAPQLSVPVTMPQSLVSRAQKTGSDSLTQVGPPSVGVPPVPPPVPVPDEPPVVDAPVDPPVGPVPDVTLVVPVGFPEAPPVPDVTPAVVEGAAPATPVETLAPPALSSPETSPSTPCAQDPKARAADTSARNWILKPTRIGFPKA